MIALLCFIEGDPNIFRVSISPSHTIDDLKDEIYKKKYSSSFDPKDLTLTKVRYIIVSI